MEIIRRTSPAEDAAASADRSVTVTMSTDQKDRMGDRIAQDGVIDGQRFGRGLLLDEYEVNPVVQPWHEYRALPLGSVDRIWRDSVTVGGRTVKRTRGRIVFATAAANPVAEHALRLFRSGHLRGVSIGFLPEKADTFSPRGEAERKRLDLGSAGMIFGTATLWELSIAPLPANVGAVAGAALSCDARSGLCRMADVAQDVGHRDLADMIRRSVTGSAPATVDMGGSAGRVVESMQRSIEALRGATVERSLRRSIDVVQKAIDEVEGEDLYADED